MDNTGHKTNAALKLMTHVVAGYPNLQTTADLLKTMEQQGVSWIEVQIPFSDPMGDGPTIMRANQKALDNGITVPSVLDFIGEMNTILSVPLLIMTYANIPFRYGFKAFVKTAQDIGVKGMIIPDIPYDEETENFFDMALSAQVPVIPVISPGTADARLKDLARYCTYMVYCTLRVGITGARAQIDAGVLSFFERVRSYIDCPLAAGFGISKREHIEMLSGAVDIAVIGSHIINLFDTGGLVGVERFLRELL